MTNFNSRTISFKNQIIICKQKLQFFPKILVCLKYGQREPEISFSITKEYIKLIFLKAYKL